MGYSKSDRRAGLLLAVMACVIVIGIMLFGQRELPIVQVAPLPNEFFKVLKSSGSRTNKPYESYKSHRTYMPNRDNQPYKSYRSYNDYKPSRYSDDLEHPEPSRPTKFSQLTIVDLNSADTTLLKRIPGIGSNIARWIVERRDKLGGFYAVDQLLEVRHVEPSMLEWFSVDTSLVRRVRICDMTFAEMSRFPYIGYDKAKAISNYQRLYGPITDFEQLRNTTIFTDEELEKLRNYIF